MRSIELINSILAPQKTENESDAKADFTPVLEKLDDIGATMEGIFNKLNAQSEKTEKKAKTKKTDESAGDENGKSEHDTDTD